ncbi:MAG: peptide-methionine (S)-S-oxide reductase MsrA [Saprospiraceae bacterium]|nr:peptide-methionine (S)-S-oxide reductase MsrA [Candidatus Opimibacter skivensis]
MNRSKSLLFILALFGLSSSCTSQKSSGQAEEKTPAKDQIVEQSMNTEIATFGAGCFWCVEAVFQELKGVLKVESGYMGGAIPNPTYREVCTGTTGHAEVTRITFDPTVISYEELLEVLWTTHDPTTLNRQGADAGTQYRSAIFYHSEEQKSKAEKSKKEVATTIWDSPIVTEIVAADTFYPAEEYHQDYYALNPNAGYCRAVISPKVAKVRATFTDKLKQ